MAVYVDDMYTIPLGQFGRMKMSHMAADTTEELLAMCDKIGMNKKWIQDQGEKGEHFDVSMTLRKKAIEAGAIPLSMRVLCPALVYRTGCNEKLDIEKYQKEHNERHGKEDEGGRV